MAERCRVIAVCGHEAAYGRASAELGGPDVIVVPNGRELFRTVVGLSRRGEASCVVPMTLGRDPELVAETARTLRAVPDEERAGTVLAEPFGTAQHLVGWLRGAARRVPTADALLVTAPSGGPFEDAELYRVASLVRSYGNHALVEVALTGGDPGLAQGVRRCVSLGAARVVVLPAAFVVPEAPDVPDAQVAVAGPPLARSALRRVLAERAADALRRRHERGDDGIAAGLGAADNHGHHHTHPPGTGHEHAPGHGHAAGHGHDHGHDHLHEHPHPQTLGAGHVLRSSA
ncbi:MULTISPECIES: cobalamin biosynthesis protein CbiX [unclassified Streptomyces]|uniref:cobalamin biosynthesis protein CbiX n=1 Tax=unclassified Streptomyces TaxID=2593676 RepID=UPI002DDB62E2|nr:cobalamin biosynthesis protein CbiX [Streptomyces sp. NBC_01237]WRZ78216.1 cobalamin biosynthesis protein CbiX [Streptomyces sp. NBC_01237]